MALLWVLVVVVGSLDVLVVVVEAGAEADVEVDVEAVVEAVVEVDEDETCEDKLGVFLHLTLR